MYDLSKMKLLARGGQADVYEIDADRVLRVLRDAQGAGMLMNERDIMVSLRQRGVGVPEVYGYVEVDGLPALVVQRVSGPSMLRRMQGDAFGLGRTAQELARLHKSVLESPALSGLEEIKSRARHLAGRSEHLDEQDKAFVLSLLDGLPDGDSLLHGDFHPGNILTGGGKTYIIDWFGAARGHFAADIAHSYVLLADKPRIPGEGAIRHRLMKSMARQFADLYLKEIRLATGLDMAVFGKWAAVRAAERTVYGHPSELGTKAAFVKACRAMHDKGIDSAAWHEAL